MPLLAKMVPRDTTEEHRAATPLELFFDLTFVVAVAQASEGLHHGLVDGNAARALLSFPLVFFAIWWAWMNFTWFASAYDNDDVPYRIAVFVQMTGVLILAAGVPRAFEDVNFGVMTLGYVVMRLAMVALWIRAGLQHVEGRPSAFRYAIGIAVVQVGWVARLWLPDDAGLVAFFVLAAIELAIPIWAEQAGRTPWHPRHIAERYGLFTIIVLGESVLSATVGVQAAIDLDTPFGDLGFVIVGGLLTLFAMWWIYFDLPNEQLVERVRRDFAAHIRGAFTWGYGHFPVFASACRGGWRTPRRGRPRHAPLRPHQSRVRARVHHPRMHLLALGVGGALPVQAGHVGAELGRADGGRPDPRVERDGRTRARDRAVDGGVGCAQHRRHQQSERSRRSNPLIPAQNTVLTTTNVASPHMTTRNIDAPRKARTKPTRPATASAATSPL